jgi:hypothetical protein
VIVHSGANRASIPTEPAPISNAKLAAELQAVALALRIGGLDGLRSGQVTTLALPLSLARYEGEAEVNQRSKT